MFKNIDTDTRLMLRFKEGDTGAFKELFIKYRRKILNFCYRFCADRRIAEELAQEVFLRVYQSGHRYRPKAKFSTWLFRIAANVCLNEVRKPVYRQAIEPMEATAGTEMADTGAPPSNALEDKEKALLVRRALADLPENQRAAVLLRIDHGFSYGEIGMQLNCSEKSVKALIHRSRLKLKAAMAAYVNEE